MQFGEESSLLDHAACARRLSTMISGLFFNAHELCEAMTKLKLEGYDLDCVINYMGDGYYGNPLFLAIDHLDATAVRHLFQFGGNIHLVDSTTNFSLMHFAARRGDMDMIELLIEMGVSMTDVQEELQTAVYVRNHTATTAILELSIDLLDLTYVGKTGKKPLLHTSMGFMADVDIVKTLLSYPGWDFYQLDQEFGSFVHAGVNHLCYSSLQYVLSCPQIDCNISNWQLVTPLVFVIISHDLSQCSLDVIKLFLSYPSINPNAVMDGRGTMLHWLANNPVSNNQYYALIVAALLECERCDPNIPDQVCT
jgi:ankyrin repeat protein